MMSRKGADRSFQNRPEPWMAEASVHGRIYSVFWKDLSAPFCSSGGSVELHLRLESTVQPVRHGHEQAAHPAEDRDLVHAVE